MFAPVKAEYLNLSDSVAAVVACILQEQLAPILETIRTQNSDWQSALLNHSTIMNRYNVGKARRPTQPSDQRKPRLQVINYNSTSTRRIESARPTTTVIAARTESPQRDYLPPSERSPSGSSSSVSSLYQFTYWEYVFRNERAGFPSTSADASHRTTSCEQLIITADTPASHCRWLRYPNDQAGFAPRTRPRRDTRFDVELVRPLRTYSYSRAGAPMHPAIGSRGPVYRRVERKGEPGRNESARTTLLCAAPPVKHLSTVLVLNVTSSSEENVRRRQRFRQNAYPFRRVFSEWHA